MPKPRGESSPQSLLTAADVVEIRRLHRLGLTQVQLAKKYGVSEGRINNVVLRKTWAHVG